MVTLFVSLWSSAARQARCICIFRSARAQEGEGWTVFPQNFHRHTIASQTHSLSFAFFFIYSQHLSNAQFTFAVSFTRTAISLSSVWGGKCGRSCIESIDLAASDFRVAVERVLVGDCSWLFFLITPSGQSQPHSSPSIRAAHRPRQHWGANKIKKDALSLRLLVPVLDEMDEEMRTNTRSVIFLSLAWLTHSCNVRYGRWILKSAFLMFSFMRLARWLLALLYSIASLISFLYSRCN